MHCLARWALVTLSEILVSVLLSGLLPHPDDGNNDVVKSFDGFRDDEGYASHTNTLQKPNGTESKRSSTDLTQDSDERRSDEPVKLSFERGANYCKLIATMM